MGLPSLSNTSRIWTSPRSNRVWMYEKANSFRTSEGSSPLFKGGKVGFELIRFLSLSNIPKRLPIFSGPQEVNAS